jgi:hypothetical protein
MKKNFKKKQSSGVKKFWCWLGKQNVFLVFAVLFLSIYGSAKAYTYFFTNEDFSEKRTNKPSTKAIETSQTTPSPTIKNPDFDTIPFIFPSLETTTSPIIDQDPIVDCTRPDECGGETVQIKQSECFNKVCCPVGDDKYETLTSVECYEKRVEYLKRQNEEYIEKRDEAYQKSLDEYKKLNEQYESELNKKLLDQQNTNKAQQEEYEIQVKLQYDVCVSNARDKAYRECAARNTCDSWGYGSPTWEIEQETIKCKQMYGY